MKIKELIFSKKGGRGKEREGWRREIQLRYVVSTYMNITVYSPVWLLFANKIVKRSTALSMHLMDVFILDYLDKHFN
jgi:hypothetical protein